MNNGRFCFITYKLKKKGYVEKKNKFLTSFPRVPNTTIMHPSAEAILSDPCSS